MFGKEVNRRGQLTIFIIIGILIVGAAVTVFILRDKLFVRELSSDAQPVYTTFLSCLEENTLEGIDLLESQAGYIELPEFESGSEYMPFGSQLNFLGNPVPYWYYVSGNNIQKEQVPSVKEMEIQLADYVKNEIWDCSFDLYYLQGFEIDVEEPQVDVSINANSVVVFLNGDFSIIKGDNSDLISTHEIEVNSNLGKLYDSAREIYDKEQKELFLENYAVDVLRLYAPVDGVELTCSPLTWNANEVFNELQEAIELNTLSLKVKSNDFTLNKEENKYFIVDSDVSADVRFLTFRNWTNRFEVSPTQESLMIARPVGNQPGLGILGFCYVPYHFVYDVSYPVLVQLSEGEEIFQFPVAVVLQGNKPRTALDVDASIIEIPEICEYKNTLINVKTYDTKLNSVEAEISFECSGSFCSIGKTSDGLLSEEFPQCGNGYIIAEADGFKEARYLQSTIAQEDVNIILDRLYEKTVDLRLEGESYKGAALVSFVNEDSSKTIVYPGQNQVSLSEGQYEVQVHIFRNSSLKLQESVTEQCVDVPQNGFGGIFGLTEEKCFEIKIPEQIISNALDGGGIENYYIIESELANSETIEINAQSLPVPSSLEQLQNNYGLFESKGLDIMFK